MSSPELIPLDEVKRDEIWFEDGSIVIVAEAVAFRVYKGLLSAVSPVFNDLFSLPQNEPDEQFTEMMDGCRVARVQDSAIQMRHFLSAVTQPSFYVELLDSYHIIPFDTLAAIVRMAHKYQAEEIVTAAACRLDTFFAKFSAHATLLIEICAVESRRKWNIDWLTLWKWTEHVASVKVELSHATEAVNLARFLGRPAWVPFAIFLCCVGDPLHLRNGVRREDGELERLSDEDYMRCIRAIPVIREKSYQLVHDLLVSHHTSLFSPLSSCTQKQHCQAIFKEIVSEFKEERFFPQALTDIHVRLSCWSRLPEAIRRKRSDICPACWVRLTSNGQHELYSKIWEQIAGSINVAL